MLVKKTPILLIANGDDRQGGDGTCQWRIDPVELKPTEFPVAEASDQMPRLV
jgi:hypothetical protein